MLNATDHSRDSAGMKYVYLGNMPGRMGNWEDTRCHQCGETLITRRGFAVIKNNLPVDGKCPKCATAIPGIWS